MDFYDIEFKTAQGEIKKMSDYSGSAVLIVNTATRCGLAPQFKELEDLHQKYKDEGLVVIGFPCNQFQNQEPVTNENMEQHCEVNFGVTFQLAEKIDVNGKSSHPVFSFLKEQLPGKIGRRIKWNFTKFLISPDGLPQRRYAPTVKPGAIEKDIIEVLPVQLKAEPAE